jgi:hypothetical protein
MPALDGGLTAGVWPIGLGGADRWRRARSVGMKSANELKQLIGVYRLDSNTQIMPGDRLDYFGSDFAG